MSGSMGTLCRTTLERSVLNGVLIIQKPLRMSTTMTEVILYFITLTHSTFLGDLASFIVGIRVGFPVYCVALIILGKKGEVWREGSDT